MPKLSIRRRLIASVFATQLILTVALVALATYFTRGQLRAAFDAGLHGRAMSVAALIRYSEEGNHELIFDRELSPPSLDRHHPDFYQIVDESGHVIGASSNWPGNLPGPSKPGRQYWDVTVDGVHYRTVRLDHLPVLDREGPDTKSNATITVIYAAPTDEFREDLWHAAILTLAGSLLLLAIATLVVAWAIRQGLSPLATLAVSAGKVSASDWNLNLPEDATATEELAPLTRAMETMLATLYRAFSSQQEFLANAAHELKTPVAILKSTLQSMVQVPRTADEYRAADRDRARRCCPYREAHSFHAASGTSGTVGCGPSPAGSHPRRPGGFLRAERRSPRSLRCRRWRKDRGSDRKPSNHQGRSRRPGAHLEQSAGECDPVQPKRVRGFWSRFRSRTTTRKSRCKTGEPGSPRVNSHTSSTAFTGRMLRAPAKQAAMGWVWRLQRRWSTLTGVPLSSTAALAKGRS